MNRNILPLAQLGVAVSLLMSTAAVGQTAAAPAAAAASAPTNVKGMITARNGDQMTVTAADGTKTVVTLSDATIVQASEGALGIRKDSEPATALINGLPVSVDIAQSGTQANAMKVSFKASDLKTATMIQAGVAQEDANLTAAEAANAAQTAELQTRMSEINQYDNKGTTTVLFATNSANLSAQAKKDLCAAATTAKGIKGYLIGVSGFADSSGRAQVNQRLSNERAARVVEYLEQVCQVQPYRVLSPAAMSTADPAASNETASGKAENRRVTVSILVSKGLEGM